MFNMAFLLPAGRIIAVFKYIIPAIKPDISPLFLKYITEEYL
ncbi:hypothetical protein P20311_3139 [Pseudoalteromonas sp. BSi20311]|nr:hypothetical protein P20311_3139 [Pseudoalteromonas sp. BSi20311]